MGHHFVEAVRDAEEIRAVNLIDLYAFRDGQVFQIKIALRVFIRVDLVMQGSDMCLLVGVHQEQHHRQNQTYLDGYR